MARSFNFDMCLTSFGHALAHAIENHTMALAYAEAAPGRTGMQRSTTHAGQRAKP